MKRARFISAASREFLAEDLYYNEHDPDYGSRFITAVEEATARALAFPYAGSPSAAGTRRVFVNSFPHSVVYRPEPDGIIDFAVTHSSRHPDYWRSRIR